MLTELTEMTVLEWYVQDLHGSAVYVDEHSYYRATIKRNFYDFQSFAKVEVWSASAGWLEIQTFPITGLAVADYKANGSNDGSWEEPMLSSLAAVTFRCLEFLDYRETELG